MRSDFQCIGMTAGKRWPTHVVPCALIRLARVHKVCGGISNLDGIWVVADGLRVCPLYPLLTDLSGNSSLTVIQVNAAIRCEGGVNECMLVIGALSIVCRRG